MKVTYGRGYVYSLHYHIVFCVKYRHKVLSDELALRVHLLIDCTPQHFLPDLIKVLKGNTARWLFMEYPELKKKLWGGHLWNPINSQKERGDDA